jgi:hypothetical protein
MGKWEAGRIGKSMLVDWRFSSDPKRRKMQSSLASSRKQLTVVLEIAPKSKP